MEEIRSKAVVATAVALMVLAGSFVIVAGADAAPGMRFGANYQLNSSLGRGVDVPGLAVDPTNPAHIVEANIDPVNSQCEYHVSSDGGQTWVGGVLTVPAPTSAFDFPSPACGQDFDSGGYAHFNAGIVFGSGQNVYITFSIHEGIFNRPENGPTNDGGNGDDAVVAHSTDGGQSFAPAVVAVPGGGPTSLNPGLAGYGMRPQIAVQPGAGTGGQDRLYVDSWNCYIRIRASQTSRGGCSGGGGDRRIFVTRSDDGGTTWTTPVLASAANVRAGTAAPFPGTGAAGEAGSTDEQAVEPSQPVVGPDGTVYVAYKNRDITDGTTCPTNPIIAPTQAGFPDTKAWCVVVAKSTDNGLTWTHANTGVPVPKTLVNPRLAIDPTVGAHGKLYIVYQMQTGTPPVSPASCALPTCDQGDIMLQSSTDGGVTWSPRVRVNHDPSPGAVQTNPWVAVGPGGVVDVIWNDQRNQYPGGATRMGDIYFSSSTDGGVTFSPDRRITDRSINISVGLYTYLGSDFSNGFDWYGPVALPLPDGSVLTAWTDSRGGNFDNGFQDIYLSRLSATAGIAKSTTATATPDGLSVVLSRMAYPGGPEATNGDSAATPVTKLVVVNDNDVAGALAGAVLARANWGPLLLTPSGGLPAIVKAEAARMVPEGAYLIGDSSSLSAAVSSDVTAATRNGQNVVQIAPATNVPVADRPADTARQIAQLMSPLPTPTAVIVDPGTPEAASASALAAALQYPLLFVDTRATLPPPTQAALTSLGITKALIVGGTGAVNAGVETSLDTALGAGNVTRLACPSPANGCTVASADQYTTSQAVLQAAIGFGLPANSVYVADGSRPIDGALLGATVARLGGLMLLTPSASTDTAETTLGTLGLDAGTDRIIAAIGTGGTDPVVPPTPQHSLTVTFAGTGSGKVTGSGITCPGLCSLSAASGTSVSLTATPNAGSTFAGWSGNCGGKAACTGTLSSDLKVTATFRRVPPAKCTLRVKSNKVPLKQGKKRGTLSVTARCDQKAGVSLSGVLIEAIGKRRTSVFRIGPVRSSVRANVSTTLALRLPARALSGLKNKRHETISLTLTASNTNGKSRASAKVANLKRG